MGVCGQLHAPASLSPGKRPDTHCREGWVGLRVALDGRGKSLPIRFDPRTVQPVASRYNDCAIPAHLFQAGAENIPQRPDQLWASHNLGVFPRGITAEL